MARLAALVLALIAAAAAAPAQPLTPVPFNHVRLRDTLFVGRMETNRRITIPACLRKCEETGRLRNFAVAGGLETGKHEGRRYNDSDVYKVLEGIAYSLQDRPDPALEKRADAVIDAITVAQRKDGYLNTWVQLAKPEARWKNIAHGHELYCAGHLIEAGIAYRHATGKRKLLDVGIRFADLIDREFGLGERMDPPGHQEIELALVKLFRETGEKRYLELARFFLDRRGNPEGRSGLFGKYCQDHLPVRDQFEAEGHAVRLTYQLIAMADVAAATGDKELRATLERMWEDLALRKTYITGGIGDSASNEGFTGPHVLPNDTAYAETCAAIGMALWNHRMFLLTGDGKYMDMVERVVLNGLLSGVSMMGNRFFYPNPLGSRGGVARVPWFSCSCCPVNIARFIPAMGERFYAVGDDTLWVGLYFASQGDTQVAGTNVRIRQAHGHPFEGTVVISVAPERPAEFTLALRRPGWLGASKARLLLNGEPISPPLNRGFWRIRRTWAKRDCVEIELPMPVRRMKPHPKVTTNRGRVALMRGPFVLCLEGKDHGGHVRNIALPPEAELTGQYVIDAWFGGLVVVRARGLRARGGARGVEVEPVRIRAIPYYLWANREPGEMVVWIPETLELAELPGAGPATTHAGLRIRASHCWPGDTVTALNDGKIGKTSGDHALPRMTWWPRRGTTEWVEYEFPEPRTIGRSRVYWFDDTGRGACRVPKGWRLLYRDGDAWKPVALKPGATYGTATDRWNRVAFEPIRTRRLRLEVTLGEDVSGGILEWRTEG